MKVTWDPAEYPSHCDAAEMPQAPRLCIANKLPEDTDAAGHTPCFEEQRFNRLQNQGNG